MSDAGHLEKKMVAAVNVAKQKGVPDDKIVEIIDRVKSQVKSSKWVKKPEEGPE